MSVVRLSQIAKYAGLSSDVKPTDSTIVAGATFLETDTTRTYVYDGANWSLQDDPTQALIGTPTELRHLAMQAATIGLLSDVLTELQEARRVLATAYGIPYYESSGQGTAQRSL